MAVNVVTGLTAGETKAIEDALKPFFAENLIGSVYQPYYMTFAKTIKNKTTQEAQIELDTWNARGLNKSFLITIAKNIANKDLV
jgi:hypothetical protein